MASVRSGVASLVRRAFTVRAPAVATSSCSPFSTTAFPSSAAGGASTTPLLSSTSSTRTWNCSSTSSVSSSSSSSSSSRSSGKSQQLVRQQHQQRSGLSTLRRGLTGPASARLRLPMRGLEEFRDPEIVKAGDVPIVGRSWTVQELRRKSFEDLHKLWFVLYKEKNMLMSEVLVSRRTKVPIPAGDRRQKVKRSMKAIKVVVGERQRAKRAVIRERQLAAKRQKREEAAAAAAAAAEAEAASGEAGLEKGSQSEANI